MTAKTWKQNKVENSNQGLWANITRGIPEDKIMVSSKSEIIMVKSLLDEL